MNIIFDIDGTIWNTTGIIAKAWQAASDSMGLSKTVITPELLKKEFGKTMDVIAREVFPDVPAQKDLDDLIGLCCEYEEEALEKMDQETVDSIVYDGILETMRKLSRKHRLYIVSNCQSGYIEMNIAKCGTEDIITDHLCYGETGMSKGDTMLELIRRNGLSVDECVYVGDIQGDLDQSRYAGVRFIHAGYGFGKVNDPDARIRKPTGLIRAVANMEKQINS